MLGKVSAPLPNPLCRSAPAHNASHPAVFNFPTHLPPRQQSQGTFGQWHMSSTETKSRCHKAQWVWRQPKRHPGNHPHGPNHPFLPPFPTLGAFQQRVGSHNTIRARALPEDTHTAQNLPFSELVGKRMTTSTPDQRLLTPNHIAVGPGGTVSTNPLVSPESHSPAAAGIGVSSRKPESGFPPQETGTAVTKSLFP